MEDFNISLFLFFFKIVSILEEKNFLFKYLLERLSFHYLLITTNSQVHENIPTIKTLTFLCSCSKKKLFMIYFTFHSHSTHSACKLIAPLPDIIYTKIYSISSRPDVFCKKSVLRNFAIFTEKLLCQGLFSNLSLQLY